MDALLFFLLWGVVMFLMIRKGCGSHVMGEGHGRDGRKSESSDHQYDAETLRWVPPATDVDPVCHKTVHTNAAKPSVHDGSVYYFCSRECREVFEAAPDLYVGPDAGDKSTQLEKSHV
ncbi:MAG: YHS domain-containing protein [Rhodospirillales bacterium]|tara:strand:+ start:22739 stop:23092 length:354 start_codon:yes stop_codon:yes gene_type:complete